jgi:KDO2-lipid IV(A) lauroyltransferase
MSQRSALRNVAEYAGVRALVATSRVIPKSWVPGLCRMLGGMLSRVLAGRRGVVFDNVRLAYGDDPAAPDPAAISRSSFGNLCRSFLELFLLPHASRPQDLVAAIKFREGSSVDELRARAGPGPYVFAASHFGAWEIPGAASSLLGMPLTTLMRPLDNPLLDAYLNRIRMRFGQRLASNRGGLRDLTESLASGRSVAVLIDLNMRRKGAVFVDYFATPAATARTAALLALRFERPLVPVFAHRSPEPYRFEIEVGDPIVPDPEAPRSREIHRLLSEATAALERRVRATPGSWLWTHRRWKTRPQGEKA